MHIQLVRNDAVATVRLNRPEALNALSEEMKEELTGIFSALAADAGVRAVVLAAAGRAFCVSGDVRTLSQPDLESSRARLARAQRMIVSLHSIDKPVIAAVRGAVAGIGWSMVMACDQVLASPTAFFAQVFKNMGLAPDGGAIYFLAQHIGVLRAKELVLSGRRLPAAEALGLGLVTRIVPDESLEQEAGKLAQELASGPTRAFGLGKQLFRQAAGTTLESYLKLETEAQIAAFQTKDHKEGVQAFLDKRPPRFEGR